jgi:hypothetical protein
MAAHTRLREWADAQLVGHTDFNSIFYQLLTLFGKIQAASPVDEVTKAAEDVAFSLWHLADFFETRPYNVTTFDELKKLGAELVRLRETVGTLEREQQEAATRPAEVRILTQDLDPVLQALARIGSSIFGLDAKLDNLIKPEESKPLLLESSTPANHPLPAAPENAKVKQEEEVYFVTLERYTQWLEETRVFERQMRDNLATLQEHQESLKYGASGQDRSGEIQVINLTLSNLAATRQPIEQAIQRIKSYLAALKTVQQGVQEDCMNIELPAINAGVQSRTAEPSVEADQSEQDPVKDTSTEVAPMRNRSTLVTFGGPTNSSPAEVFVATLFEMIPRKATKARGLTKMIQQAIESGLASRFGWETASAIEEEFKKAKESGHVKLIILRMHPMLKGKLILSRSSTPLPWSISEIFSDDDVLKFYGTFEKK